MANISVGEAIKALEKAGFTKKNQKGSHVIYSKGNQRIVLVLHSSPKEVLSFKVAKELKKLIKL